MKNEPRLRRDLKPMTCAREKKIAFPTGVAKLGAGVNKCVKTKMWRRNRRSARETCSRKLARLALVGSAGSPCSPPRHRSSLLPCYSVRRRRSPPSTPRTRIVPTLRPLCRSHAERSRVAHGQRRPHPCLILRDLGSAPLRSWYFCVPDVLASFALWPDDGGRRRAATIAGRCSLRLRA